MEEKFRVKVDCHVHSIFSERPSEWLLKTIGTRESYTKPDDIYQTAIENGMDFVTITDHNKIDGVLLLKNKYPEKVFTGVEATCYFPEDYCKIHILIFGFSESQFQEIDLLRRDIYQLREYLKQENLAYSVAHGTFSINGKLTVSHLEKLILLFDVFETVNGGRDKNHNLIWNHVLNNLTPDHINDLYKKHRISPLSNDPWIKGFTGGSDDHGGLFIGQTYTYTDNTSVQGFLNSIKEKKTNSCGRHNDFYSLAFTVYKVAYEFLMEKGTKISNQTLNSISSMLFEKRNPTFKERFFFKKIQKSSSRPQEILYDLIENKIKDQSKNINEKLEGIYDNISDFSDEFFKVVFKSIEEDIGKLDIIGIMRKISSSFLGVFITLPFLSSLKIMFQDSALLKELAEQFQCKSDLISKNILWFTDTYSDLNGVSMTLRKIAELSSKTSKKLKIAVSLLESEIPEDIPETVLLLPYMYFFIPEIYNKYTIKIPSILSSFKKIHEVNPNQIIVSTPGPMGLLGLLAAKLLKVECRAVYHSDFTKEFENILGKNTEVSIVENYVKWFYHQFDEILVPTQEYISILEKRGYDIEKMKIFKRGVDVESFEYKETGRKFIKEYLSIEKGPILLYTGRISEDKNLKFLFQVCLECKKKWKDLKIIIAGDGPDLPDLKKEFFHEKDIFFPGLVSQKILPYFYSGADILIFPSTTDTFGMSVLEAQACGLPAIVSQVGGPKEIIKDGETGYIADSSDMDDWINKLDLILNLKENHFHDYQEMRKKCIARVHDNYNWSTILDGYFS